MAIFFLAMASLSAPAVASAQPSCVLTSADKTANAALSFDDFDQKGTSPSTFRVLSNRGCMREAAEATEDYLVNGPARTDFQQRVIIWHMAQSLALAGDERQAAWLMAGTRDPAGDNDRIDWNDYMKASWAFLVKNRAAFDIAAAELAKSTRPSDRNNSELITGMGRCWGKSYKIAYDRNCSQ